MNMSGSRTLEIPTELLTFIVRNGPVTMYKVSRATGKPYATTLRIIKRLEEGGMVKIIKYAKRRSKVYMATPVALLLCYIKGSLTTYELLTSLLDILANLHDVKIKEMQAIEDPIKFLIDILPHKLYRAETIDDVDAVYILGALLIYRYREWYKRLYTDLIARKIGKDRVNMLYSMIRMALLTLRKLKFQVSSLEKKASRFIEKMGAE